MTTKISKTSDLIAALAEVLLPGEVILHAGKVTAGRGRVVDWRTVPSGEELAEGLDAYDTALLLVSTVGSVEAARALARVSGLEVSCPRCYGHGTIYWYLQRGGEVCGSCHGRGRIGPSA